MYIPSCYILILDYTILHYLISFINTIESPAILYHSILGHNMNCNIEKKYEKSMSCCNDWGEFLV